MKNRHSLTRFAAAVGAAGLSLLCGAAQTPAKRDLAFEAASVKPSIAQFCATTMQGGPGTPMPGRVMYTCMNLTNLLSQAYEVGYDSVLGPGWLQDARFDVVATIPRGARRKISA